MSRARALSWTLALVGSLLACKADPPEPEDRAQAGAPEPATAANAEALREADITAAKQRAQGMIKAFASELQTTLLAAIEAGGLADAIRVCKVDAPAITAKQASEGWTLQRTALKVRNRANTPTDWQRQVLDGWQAQIAAGEVEDLSTLDWAEVVETDAGPRLRYMKAIPLGGVCLGCHGPADSLEPAVTAALADGYPDDQATGFRVGELRGAFVVEGPVQDAVAAP